LYNPKTPTYSCIVVLGINVFLKKKLKEETTFVFKPFDYKSMAL
jgi:hypothetical protein